MRIMIRLILIAILCSAATAVAADPHWTAAFGRASDSQDTDIVRLAYRHPVNENSSIWMPTHAQLGASLWRVPDIRGTTRRFDMNATAIWRSEKPWGYLEAGFGGYLMSKTINNEEHRLPSSWQFGSHLGIGLALGGGHSIGVGVQHLSNAGIKKPNGGIDLILVQYAVATGTHH